MSKHVDRTTMFFSVRLHTCTSAALQPRKHISLSCQGYEGQQLANTANQPARAAAAAASAAVTAAADKSSWQGNSLHTLISYSGHTDYRFLQSVVFNCKVDPTSAATIAAPAKKNKKKMLRCLLSKVPS